MRTSMLPTTEILRRANNCLRYLWIMLASSASLMILSSIRTVRRESRKRRPRNSYSRSSHRCGKTVSDEKKKENSNSELKSQKPSEVSAVLNKKSLPPLHTNGQVQFTENVSVTKLVDDVKGAKPLILSDKKPVVANGIANGVANAC